MTLSNEEIKEVGLAVSTAVAFGAAPNVVPGLLADLTHDELVALVTATTEIYIASATKQVTFRNWLREVVEEASAASPTSPIIPALVAVGLAAEATLG